MFKKVANTSLRITLRIGFLVLSLYLIYFVGTRAFSYVYDYVSSEATQNQPIKNVEIVIPRGANTRSIAKLLQEGGLIKNATIFSIRVKFSEYDGKFRYGTYVLNTGMSEDEIMKVLATQGERRATVQFTIPEGFSVQQIAKKLESEGLCSASDFIEAINNVEYDYDFYKLIPDRNFKLQGYLFPDTYEIYTDASAVDIVSTMLARFDVIFTKEYIERAARLGYSIDEIITLASLIEKEAKLAEERPIISGVMYNRLAIDMPLQIDATVQYVKTNGEYTPGRILYEDLEIDSPYNTYRYKGIPIGPISNPGRAAIHAALYPEDHDYFYYLLINEATGQHVFNRTLQEHNRDKSKYIR